MGLDDPNVVDLLLDAKGTQATSCDATCTSARGTLNHLAWPDGMGAAGDSSTDWERAMITFLRNHPLP